MSSSQTDASLFVPSVEDLRDLEARLIYVAGQFLHVNDELHLALAVEEKRTEEVPQSLFYSV